MKKAYLLLENGQILEGKQLGAEGSCVGELVFTTNMCGYIETLTDPGYFGQIVLQTFPLVGNYGIMEEDFEGKCNVKGYVVRECCDVPSNFRSEYDLDTFLKKNGIPGICDVDTRELTAIIRDNGVMNAMICSEIPKDTSMLSSYTIQNASDAVTISDSQIFSPEETHFHVALLDYGVRKSIITNLQEKGCQVTVLPCHTTAKEILAMQPDGVILSGGPGNPAEMSDFVAEIQKLFGILPIWGIGLGHQLLALANHAKIEKLKYGHRGANQPVKDLLNQRTYMTQQNHGYTVITDNLNNGVLRYINANDNTCEGIDYPENRAFSVQFYPESDAGFGGIASLYERFIEMMEAKNNAH